MEATERGTADDWELVVGGENRVSRGQSKIFVLLVLILKFPTKFGFPASNSSSRCERPASARKRYAPEPIPRFSSCSDSFLFLSHQFRHCRHRFASKGRRHQFGVACGALTRVSSSIILSRRSQKFCFRESQLYFSQT